MGDQSKIEWTEATWNPTVGCSRTSPGCDRCYAIGVAHRAMSPQHVGLTVKPKGERTDWTGEVRVVEHLIDQPIRWKRPRRVFVNSMSDLFHPALEEETIARIFAVMAVAGQHTFQCLTKRSKRMWQVLDQHAFWGEVGRQIEKITGVELDGPLLDMVVACEIPNVHLGVSIESDKYAFRAEHLRLTPAAVRWISAEPLLGPLPSLDLTGIDWVVVGGESGPGSRPMHPDWVRDLRDRCMDVNTGSADQFGTSFFFKQWGDWVPGRPDQNSSRSSMAKTPVVTQAGGWLDVEGRWRDTNELTSFRTPDDWVQMARVGKKNTGRELDGREWSEYPT